MTAGIIIVGLVPGSGSSVPLSCLHPGSGRTLARLCGLPPEEYERGIDRINLYGCKTHAEAADAGDDAGAARNLLPVLRGRRVLVLGRRVRAALVGRNAPLLTWIDAGDFAAAAVPHPSGRYRWWNSRENTERAARFLAESMRPSVRVEGLYVSACASVARQVASVTGLSEVEEERATGLDLTPGRVTYGKSGPVFRTAFKLGAPEENARQLRVMSRHVTFFYAEALLDRASVFRYRMAMETVRSLGGTVIPVGPGGLEDGVVRSLINTRRTQHATV